MRASFGLAGCFGFGNAGDEMIARSVRGAAPEARWRTLGAGLSRWNPASLSWELLRAKALVYGGGELFQTRTSRRSLLYYAALPALARACGASFAAYGMGLDRDMAGPDLSRAARALDRAARLWFRDEASLALYRSAGGKAPASVAPDPAWTWPVPEGPESPSALRRVLWIPRSPLTEERLRALAERAGGAPAFLFLQPSRDVRAFGGLPAVESWEDPAVLPSLFLGHDAVVSMRYHGLVLAALTGRPAVALAAHGKVAVVAAALGFPVLPPDAPSARVAEALAGAFERRRDVFSRAEPLRQAARRGLGELREFLEAL
jgi:polysaccharide pyruvyl transferase WcaK-like protein